MSHVLDKPTLQRSMFPKNLWLQAYLNQNNYTAIISYGNSLLLHNSSFTIGSEIILKLDGFVPCFFYTIQRSYIQKKKKNLHLNQNAIPKIKNSTNTTFLSIQKNESNFKVIFCTSQFAIQRILVNS